MKELKIKTDKLTRSQLETINEYINRVGESLIVVKPYFMNRTDAENRYYWGVVVKIVSDELGYKPAEVHEWIKAQFFTDKQAILDILYLVEKDPAQFIMEVAKILQNVSTATVSTLDFESKMEEIRAFFAEQGIFIPKPNEEPFIF